MAVTVDPTLVALGQAEPSLQIEIVTRQLRVITPDEQPRGETPCHATPSLRMKSRHEV
jgi:hypothetical protein